MSEIFAWFESVKNQPLSHWEPPTEEEENEGFDLDLYPPVLGLKETPTRFVLQIEADYEDTEADREEDEDEEPYDEEAVRQGYEEHYQTVFDQQVAELTSKYGEAARDVDGGDVPSGLDPALFRHADYWQVATWTTQDRHLLVLYTMWIGDGTYSLAIHAIVARKQDA
jgi:hypothetical protein